MSEMEDKLGAILGNPQLMQQIMNMAQSLGQQSSPPPPKPEPVTQPQPPMPDVDPAFICNLMNLVGKTNIDRNQKALLCALEPYLSGSRIQKLEKTMRAVRLAGATSTLLQSGAIPFLSGR